MRKEWGRDYDTKHSQVMKVIEKVYGPETMAIVVESGLSNNPAFMKGHLAVSKAMQEDSFVEGANGAPTGRPGVNQYGDWKK